MCSATLIPASEALTADYSVPDPKVHLRLPWLLIKGVTDELRFASPTLSSLGELGYGILKVDGSPGTQFGYLGLAITAPRESEPLFIAHYARGATQVFFANLPNNPGGT